ncbi:MAG TPA: gamma-glutamylcyclotransferase family protein [Pyrinomonadaceae bacterium]|jgi:cation transport regulator ChaC|nr:gamma-glutamylcyclotransferase family protein [Pyrinomonadaceae bacterium]
MDEKRVWVFFYGTFMDPAVLTANGIRSEVMPARLHGFELEIKRRANLLPNSSAVAYGSIAKLSYDEIGGLYKKIEDTVGLVYLPEAILAETFDGALRPALCFIVPHQEDAVPDAEYLGQMVTAAKAIDLPDWYVNLIESFGR